MLRAYVVQQWFNLSYLGVEDALYDSPTLRRFVGVDLGIAAAPDETTILRFQICGRGQLAKVGADGGATLLRGGQRTAKACPERSRRDRPFDHPADLLLAAVV
jgi:hypothetical protein